jgi:hypothetical protein
MTQFAGRVEADFQMAITSMRKLLKITPIEAKKDISLTDCYGSSLGKVVRKSSLAAALTYICLSSSSMIRLSF